MPKSHLIAKAALCAALLFCGTAHAQVPEKLPTTPAYAIGTFESLGLYFNSPDMGECKVRFRAQNQTQWRQGLPLWFDARTKQYRGSLVYLAPATTYNVELMPARGPVVALSGQTRSEKFPIGQTTTVPAGENYDELVITQSGTPEAYHLVTVTDKQRAAIDVANTTPSCITVDADYVIVRGLELRNAAKHGVLIKRDRHDVVVEDCHIIGWGRVGGAPAYGNEGAHDAAVLGEYNNRNLTVQRNLLEHPRGFTNDWSEGHPAGPEGVTFDHSQGGHVIRYNTIRSSEGHGFMDAIGGNSSSSHVGNINRDSDLYGNLITNVWDDAMQVEGANVNVRIWGNYLEQTTQFVATAPTGDGPIYIFRNVFGRSRWTHEPGSSGGYLIKTGGKDTDLGRRYVFHNTALGNGGGQHVFSGHTDPRAYSRNNFWSVPGMLVRNRTGENIAESDFDYEIFKGISGPKMKNGRGGGGFLDSNGLEFFPATWIQTRLSGRQEIVRAGKKVTLSEPPVYRRNGMIDSGVRLPNFNDDFAGAGPDIGAFEQGRAPLEFGRKAGNYPLAPWE